MILLRGRATPVRGLFFPIVLPRGVIHYGHGGECCSRG